MTDPQAGAQPAALPGDNHVHTEWSWDAVAGSMEGSCARALELGLPSIAFTEHVDLTRWVLTRKQAARTSPDRVDGDGRFEPPRLDVDGYLACVERCRDRFPDLRILSGVELGEPHWFEDEIDTLLSHGAFDRVLGSMHSVELDDGPWVVDALYGDDAPPDLDPSSVVRGYLQETVRMVESSAVFAVLAHIDYPVRHWPSDGPAFDPFDFEDEFRPCSAPWRLRDARSRSTRWCRCDRRSCAGGTRPAGRRCRSAATRTCLMWSRAASPMRARWSRLRASDRVAIRTISGGAGPPLRRPVLPGLLPVAPHELACPGRLA
ncbi:MAG TPA: PHP domain-containing protein [Acidimicrobiales bacterium]|jgi:histidinol-phosphatase (PHP family)